MSRLIIPNQHVKVDAPLIFLGGPIRGAFNWQDQALDYIFSQVDEAVVVSPRRGVRNLIAPYVSDGEKHHFIRQRMWERHYLELAVKKGSVMFWLPEEKYHDCRKAYGAMTRFEAGLILGWYKHEKNTSFCLGTDGKFSELDTILFDFRLDAPDKKIHSSLQETCDEALRLAYKH